MTPAPTSQQSEPFRIYLVRHAHAAWPEPGTGDFDRQLDERGREEAKILAGMMAINNYQPQHIYCSPAARCAQTLDILRPKLRLAPEIGFHHSLYAGDIDTYLTLVSTNSRRTPGSVMIIGHNPMLEDTAHALLSKSERAATNLLETGFPTAGMLIVDNLSASRPAVSGHGHYVGLLNPRDA